MVAEAGADFIGVIVGIDVSPRQLTIEQARPVCEQSSLPVGRNADTGNGISPATVCSTAPGSGTSRTGQEAESESAMRGMEGGTPSSRKRRTGRLLTAASLREIHGSSRCQRLIDTLMKSAGKNHRYGGTGRVNDWTLGRKLVEALDVPVFLAGGIGPGNVREAIDTVHPFGIDLASGVEAEPGRKDPEKVHPSSQ